MNKILCIKNKEICELSKILCIMINILLELIKQWIDNLIFIHAQENAKFKKLLNQFKF